MKFGGQHLLLPERTPVANLNLTVPQKFGDSIGAIASV
jgi:hypothetical protein